MHDTTGISAPHLAWAVPFAGLLLSIALLPVLAPRFWHRWFPLVALGWAAAYLLPFAALNGPLEAARRLLSILAHEYGPFIVLLLALFVVAGGIRVAGRIPGRPGANLAMLAIGTLGASLFGTTGASMLLLRPLIRANAHRPHRVHVFVFFIFLVGNIGGGLTPLGDPPLFLGFLRGVDFTWTLTAMLAPTLLSAGLLLVVFYAVDRRFARREPRETMAAVGEKLRIAGGHNAVLLLAVVIAVLTSGILETGWRVPLGLGVTISAENLLRDICLIVVTLASWLTTQPEIRIENAFTWFPLREVAILFAGIFVTIAPVLEALQAGAAGPFAGLLAFVTGARGQPIDALFFWLCGGLSSMLDNAPTYLVFFDLAGGDPARLTGPLSRTLLAISMGSVFMGALTYLGNAPNFMIKAICEEQGIRMPGFFGYLAWSCGLLLPLFLLLTIVFLR